MRLTTLSLSLALVAGCSSTPPRPMLGAPLTPQTNAWTWVDFPDSSCDDGSPTGIGINGGTSENLLVFMNGGGACWDYLTCFTINTASHGPFGQTEFMQQVAARSQKNTIFDRDDADNPFHDWSFVFIPYCTGDVHTGDNVVMYEDNTKTMSRPYHHTGHRNVLAYLPRIAATWPQPKKLVLSGSSAGGYGASFNFDDFRRYFPPGGTQAYLLDDSGPVLEGSAIPDGYRMAWITQWHLDEVLQPLCGDACKDDFSLAVTAVAKKHAGDRMALLSSEQDQTIRGYLLLSPSGFQTEINNLAKDVLDPRPNVRYFYVAGETHTMLGNVDAFTSSGTPLKTWLTQMVSDDAAWKSTTP